MMDVSTQEEGALAELAAKLTEAQRNWLIGGRRYHGRGYWPLRNAMIGKGLIDRHENLTLLGSRLRAFLTPPQPEGE